MNILDLIGKKTAMPAPGQTLSGRAEPIATAETHFVNHHPLKGPYPAGSEQAVFGLGRGFVTRRRCRNQTRSQSTLPRCDRDERVGYLLNRYGCRVEFG